MCAGFKSEPDAPEDLGQKMQEDWGGGGMKGSGCERNRCQHAYTHTYEKQEQQYTEYLYEKTDC